MADPVTPAGAVEFAVTGHIAPDGSRTGDLPASAGSRDNLVSLYRAMVLARQFDARAVALQRTGRLGTYASALGEEAVAVGLAGAMRADDVFLPSFREHGAQLVRGVTPEELLLYWGGDERGSDFAGPRRDFPVCVPVGSQFPHAAGVAWAMKLRGEDRVAVCVGGDGATSKGDFYEALNLVGVWNLPAVFVIANNQWAISVPRSAQTAAPTLAHKGLAAGVPAEIVDGNDVIAMQDAVGRALARARSGGGGTLIEARTYRLSDHTTSDDAGRYRDAEEVSPHWKAEPLQRMRAFLVAEHGWDKAQEEALVAECRAEIDAAAEAYLAAGTQPPSAMFDFLHEHPPAALERQRAAVEDSVDG